MAEVADGLGIGIAELSDVVDEQKGISSELAVELSEAFGNITQFWINLQKNYEIWHAEKMVDRTLIRHFLKDPGLQSA